MNKFFSVIFGRILYTALFVLLQVAALIIMFLYFSEKFAYFYVFSILISVAVLLHLMYENGNPEYKLAWVIPILIFPIFGGFLYIMFSRNRSNEHTKKKISELDKYYEKALKADIAVLEDLKKEDKDAALQANYIKSTAHSVPVQHTKTKYFPLGEDFFEDVIEEIKNALRGFYTYRFTP